MNAIRQHVSGLQHIGIPTTRLNETIQFFQMFGFEIVYHTQNQDQAVYFLRSKGLTLEIYQVQESADVPGAIDHLAFEVDDPDAVFALLAQQGYPALEGGVQFLPFWKNGVRFFTVLGPNGEKIEFASHGEE